MFACAGFLISTEDFGVAQQKQRVYGLHWNCPPWRVRPGAGKGKQPNPQLKANSSKLLEEQLPRGGGEHEEKVVLMDNQGYSIPGCAESRDDCAVSGQGYGDGTPVSARVTFYFDAIGS